MAYKTVKEALAVSPGLTSRPSLSGKRCSGRPLIRQEVSPGLTSRPSLSAPKRAEIEDGPPVSPGLTSRPSLSAVLGADAPPGVGVSPGLTSRPSLSDRPPPVLRRRARPCRRA